MEENVYIFTTYKNWLKNRVQHPNRQGKDFDDILEMLWKYPIELTKLINPVFIEKLIKNTKIEFLDAWDTSTEHLESYGRNLYLKMEYITFLEYYYSIANWIYYNIGRLNSYKGDICNTRGLWFWVMMDNLVFAMHPQLYYPFDMNDPEHWYVAYPETLGLYGRMCVWITLDPHKHLVNLGEKTYYVTGQKMTFEDYKTEFIDNFNEAYPLFN